jgi:putative endopeptidase
MRFFRAAAASIALFSSSALASTAGLAACGWEPPPAPVATPKPAPPPAPVAEKPPVPTITLAQAGIEPSWMDPGVDPCKDYFAYACGGFVKNEEIPADRASWGATEQLQKSNLDLLHSVLEEAARSPGDDSDPKRKKLGDYYAACMDEDAVEKAGTTPVEPLLASIARVKDVRSLTAAIVELHANAIYPLFNTAPMQDLKDATQVVAGIDQQGIGLPDRDYYLSTDREMVDTVDFYRQHVERMLLLAGDKPKAAKAGAADVLRIETALARIEQDKVVRRDPYKVYNPVNRHELAVLAPSFPWDAYFVALGIPAAHEVIVNDKAYYRGVEELLQTEKPAAWRSYLRYRVLAASAPMLTKGFVDESFRLRQKLLGAKELEPRWKRCVRSVDGEMGELLGQAYVSAKFAGDSKTRAAEVVGWIEEAMRADLRLVPWMDEPTRGAALAKMGDLNQKVGYPDRWRRYDFKVTRDSYAADVQAGERFEQHRMLAKIGRPVDKTEWGMTPPTVNAYYDPQLNEIVLPAGQLQPPFFAKDFYAPVNIGDIGANTVGHEITHAFDDEGSQFDGHGNLHDWWSASSKEKFTAATTCVADQYSKYEAVPGVKLNGKLGAGENIADIGGVKLGLYALAAWQKEHPEAERHVNGFTDEKLYFLAYAQGWCSKERPELLATMARSNPHSPPRFRVNGPMIDTPAFATTYQCAAGTPMNDGNACVVW